RMAFYFVSTFAIAQTPTKQPALRLSRTKNLHFAKAPFPGFSAEVAVQIQDEKTINHAVNQAKLKQQRKPSYKPNVDHPWRTYPDKHKPTKTS
ncbi:hypothetical protein BHECKSOX_1052, partial [Bathymodiolus heckerae thiotrophic gill symbiont]